MDKKSALTDSFGGIIWGTKWEHKQWQLPVYTGTYESTNIDNYLCTVGHMRAQTLIITLYSGTYESTVIDYYLCTLGHMRQTATVLATPMSIPMNTRPTSSPTAAGSSITSLIKSWSPLSVGIDFSTSSQI